MRGKQLEHERHGAASHRERYLGRLRGEHGGYVAGTLLALALRRAAVRHLAILEHNARQRLQQLAGRRRPRNAVHAQRR